MLPCVVPFLAQDAWVVALVKPQFEVGRGQVGKGGIVRNDSHRRAAAERVQAKSEEVGLHRVGQIDSPVLGQKGNREILLGLRRHAPDAPARANAPNAGGATIR